jgi:hypothetical protein
VGEVPKAGVTEAVNVTGCPTVAGFALEETVAVVADWLIVSPNIAETLPA